MGLLLDLGLLDDGARRPRAWGGLTVIVGENRSVSSYAFDSDRDVAHPKLFSSSATLIRSPGLISPASRARRRRSVTLSTTLARWMVSLRAGSVSVRRSRRSARL